MKKKRISVSVSEQLAADIKWLAKQQGVSISKMIEKMLNLANPIIHDFGSRHKIWSEKQSRQMAKFWDIQRMLACYDAWTRIGRGGKMGKVENLTWCGPVESNVEMKISDLKMKISDLNKHLALPVIFTIPKEELKQALDMHMRHADVKHTTDRDVDTK